MRWILQMGAPGGAAQNETHIPFFSLTRKFILGGKGVFFLEIEIYVLHLSSSRDIRYLKKKYATSCTLIVSLPDDSL